jgi:hypothetical protein
MKEPIGIGTKKDGLILKITITTIIKLCNRLLLRNNNNNNNNNKIMYQNRVMLILIRK